MPPGYPDAVSSSCCRAGLAGSPGQARATWDGDARESGPSQTDPGRVVRSKDRRGDTAAGKRPAGPAQGPAFSWGRSQCLLNTNPFTQGNARDMGGPRAK